MDLAIPTNKVAKSDTMWHGSFFSLPGTLSFGGLPQVPCLFRRRKFTSKSTEKSPRCRFSAHRDIPICFQRRRTSHQNNVPWKLNRLISFDVSLLAASLALNIFAMIHFVRFGGGWGCTNLEPKEKIWSCPWRSRWVMTVMRCYFFFLKGQRPFAMWGEELNQRNHPELWRIYVICNVKLSQSSPEIEPTF